MSGFLAAALGYREFWSGDQVRALVARHRETAASLYPSSHESTVKIDARDIRLMLLFATPTQRSWLAVGGNSVYCVLDDLRKEEARVQPPAKRTDVHPAKANHDHSPTSGILHLGADGRDWLYSKDLFQDRDVVDAGRQLIGDDNT
jgi:hypothetical protein